MKEIIIAVATSLTASIIFWMIFSFFPEKKRYNKVRSKVEFDICEVYFLLCGYIDIGLTINDYGWKYSRDKIESGKVTKKDFELWLQNKCLNSSFQFDEMGKNLLPVGESLEAQSAVLSNKIEKCSAYYAFMTADEILLLRKIDARIKVYSYKESAEDRIGTTTLRPIVPNIVYMAENFTELSKLCNELRSIIWSYKKIDRSINKYLIPDLVYDRAKNEYKRGKYLKCIRLVNKSKLSPEITKYELLFKAYYKLGNKTSARESLIRSLEAGNCNSDFLLSLIQDVQLHFDEIEEWVFDILSKYYSDFAFYDAIEYAAKEQRIRDKGIETAKEIKAFYEKKLEDNSRKAEISIATKEKRVARILEELQEEEVEENNK